MISPLSNKKKAATWHYCAIRLNADCLSRLEKMISIETERRMQPVTRADVMRQCIALGLKQWEGER